MENGKKEIFIILLAVRKYHKYVMKTRNSTHIIHQYHTILLFEHIYMF